MSFGSWCGDTSSFCNITISYFANNYSKWNGDPGITHQVDPELLILEHER